MDLASLLHGFLSLIYLFLFSDLRSFSLGGLLFLPPGGLPVFALLVLCIVDEPIFLVLTTLVGVVIDAVQEANLTNKLGLDFIQQNKGTLAIVN